MQWISDPTLQGKSGSSCHQDDCPLGSNMSIYQRSVHRTPSRLKKTSRKIPTKNQKEKPKPLHFTYFHFIFSTKFMFSSQVLLHPWALCLYKFHVKIFMLPCNVVLSAIICAVKDSLIFISRGEPEQNNLLGDDVQSNKWKML